MPSRPLLDRRTVLRGFGAALSLPLLEGMLPSPLSAAPAPKKPPLRLAFLYVPNGIHMPAWTPKAEGKAFELPATLEPLAEFRDRLLVLSGLACDKARANGDGAGDHARAMAAFLTASQPRKTNGNDIRVGVSIDQVAALRLGGETRLASLEIGCEKGQLAGSCDSGYSCAYSSNLSWRSPNTPNPKETNPKAVFERLFGSADPGENEQSRLLRQRRRLSILDMVREDAADLQRQLGGRDQQKLDEYLSSLRALELRIEKAAKGEEAPPGAVKPEGPPKEYGEHLRLMADLLALAFRTDATRIATFAFANEGSNRNYKSIGVADGHHELSHHGNDKAKHEKIQKINRFHVEQLAYLLGKLKEAKEGESDLLDQTMLLYGSGIADGNAHAHDELPILLAGGGAALKSGRHVRFKRNTPIANLYLALLDRLGVPQSRFGDSTGKLEL